MKHQKQYPSVDYRVLPVTAVPFHSVSFGCSPRTRKISISFRLEAYIHASIIECLEEERMALNLRTRIYNSASIMTRILHSFSLLDSLASLAQASLAIPQPVLQ